MLISFTIDKYENAYILKVNKPSTRDTAGFSKQYAYNLESGVSDMVNQINTLINGYYS
jgi:hypothetical protein